MLPKRKSSLLCFWSMYWYAYMYQLLPCARGVQSRPLQLNYNYKFISYAIISCPLEAIITHSDILYIKVRAIMIFLTYFGQFFLSFDRSLTFVYPFGATLNVVKPAISVLSTGSVSFPLNRPVCAFHSSRVSLMCQFCSLKIS